jgi:rod shape-determining protein MreC
MIREPPAFFHRGPSPLARVTFFAIAAIAVMIADHRFRALDSVRLALTVVSHPIQQVASMPAQMLGRLGDYFTAQDRLLKENAELKTKVLEQAADAQEAKLLRAEQAQLAVMTDARAKYGEGSMVAEVVYSARNPFTRKIVVNRGVAQGVQAGMPVIDGTGVVGQVTSVGTFTSEVTLVTERDQSVPVMVVRNGFRAIAVGNGKDGLIDVPFMPLSADIQDGDLFVTSGIDATYPPGLIVAKVVSVDKNAAYSFAKIVARPTAGVDNNRFVMLLPLPVTPPPRPETKGEETARKSAGKDRPRGGGRREQR